MEVYNITQHSVGIAVNKQVQGKVLADRINEYTKPRRPPEVGEGKGSEERGGHRARHLGSAEAPA